MHSTAIGATAAIAVLADFDPGNVDDNGTPVVPQAGTYMAPAPFTTVIKGGYEVVHAEITMSPVASEGAVRHG